MDDWGHYVPVMLWVGYGIFVWLYDSSLPGYWDQQNGWWEVNIDWKYVSPFQISLTYFSKILYYAFAVQLFWNYRQRILAYFSNTYRIQLNWIRNFLMVYCIVLFVIQYALDIIDSIGSKSGGPFWQQPSRPIIWE